MKKILALFVFTVAFGFTATAQQRATVKPAAATTATSGVSEEAIVKAAAKDLDALNKFIPLNAQDKQSLQGLFEHKKRYTLDPTVSAERKDLVSQTIEAKLRATLSADQMAKLDTNQALLKQLIK